METSTEESSQSEKHYTSRRSVEVEAQDTPQHQPGASVEVSRSSDFVSDTRRY